MTPKTRLHAITILVLLALTATPQPTATPQTIIRVPQDYATLQEAVNNAANGSTIILSPGIYEGPVTIRAKNLTIKAGEPGEAILAATIGPALSAENATLTIEGLEITTHYGPAIVAVNSTLTLVDASVRAPLGTGILYYTLKPQSLTLQDSTIKAASPLNAETRDAIIFRGSLVSSEAKSGGSEAASIIRVEAASLALENTILEGPMILRAGTRVFNASNITLANTKVEVDGDHINATIRDAKISGPHATSTTILFNASQTLTLHTAKLTLSNTNLSEPLISAQAPHARVEAYNILLADTTLRSPLYTITARNASLRLERVTLENTTLSDSAGGVFALSLERGPSSEARVEAGDILLERVVGGGPLLRLSVGPGNYSVTIHGVLIEDSGSRLVLLHVDAGKSLKPKGTVVVQGLHGASGVLSGIVESNMLPERLTLNSISGITVGNLLRVLYKPPRVGWIYSGATIEVGNISRILSIGPPILVAPDPASSLGRLLLASPLNPSLQENLERAFGGPGLDAKIVDARIASIAGLFTLLWPTKSLIVEDARVSVSSWWLRVGPGAAERTPVLLGTALGTGRPGSQALLEDVAAVAGRGPTLRVPADLYNQSLALLAETNGYLRLAGFATVGIAGLEAVAPEAGIRV